MRQLSGQDASFLYLDSPDADSHGTLVFIYDPSTAPKQPVRFKAILAHVEKRLSISRVFRQKLVHVPFELDYPYWVDDPQFDIEYHVRHIALPKPGDWRQFCILVSRLHAPPLNMRRPLWEMYVIEGLDNIDWIPKGSFAVLIKGHHCALDGHTAAELTMGLHDLAADGSVSVPVKSVPYEPAPPASTAQLIFKACVNNLRSPFRVMRPALRALPVLGAAAAKFYARAVPNPSEHAVTRFNHKLSPHRVFTARGFDFADVKRIRATVPGATINDCVLSIAAGAVRHYLEAKGELTEASLRIGAPINTRSESEYGDAGNNISAFFCETHVNVADPLERLGRIRETTRNAKELSVAIGAREITDISKHSPAALNLLAMKAMNGLAFGARTGTPFANYLLSNVPGPTVPLFLCGAKLVFWNVIAPLPHSIGLMFGATSYCGRIFLAPTACREMMPDPDFFAGCIDRSFAEHIKATDALLTAHPELLDVKGQRQEGRRINPGLATMARLAPKVKTGSL